ncbi:MAG: hypothetical protein KGR26_00720 [Cyanobacteria bacterium REEB65]|nr:hypothetical protein [Cyanobacteria bacterium REEB65]
MDVRRAILGLASPDRVAKSPSLPVNQASSKPAADRLVLSTAAKATPKPSSKAAASLFAGPARAASATGVTSALAARIDRVRNPALFFGKIQDLTVLQLKALAKYQPHIIDHYYQVLSDRQAAWLTDLNGILAKTGLAAVGKPKAWQRALDTIEASATGGFHSWKSKLGDLSDLTRARIDTPTYDPAGYRQLAQHITAGLTRLHPDRRYQVETTDYTSAPADALYRGRIHLTIREVGQSTPAFNLQIGPRGLSQFLDTPMALPGNPGQTALHDVLYKGIARMHDAAHFAAIGRYVAKDPGLGEAQATRLGQGFVAGLLSRYRAELQAALHKPAVPSRHLRLIMATVCKALADQPDLPMGLLAKSLHR